MKLETSISHNLPLTGQADVELDTPLRLIQRYDDLVARVRVLEAENTRLQRLNDLKEHHNKALTRRNRELEKKILDILAPQQSYTIPVPYYSTHEK